MAFSPPFCPLSLCICSLNQLFSTPHKALKPDSLFANDQVFMWGMFPKDQSYTSYNCWPQQKVYCRHCASRAQNRAGPTVNGEVKGVW